MKTENKQENSIISKSIMEVLDVVCELPTVNESLTVLSYAIIKYVHMLAMIDKEIDTDGLINKVVTHIYDIHAKRRVHGQE